MVDYNQYYTPLDRAYHGEISEVNSRTDNIEEPLFPINQIGQTIAWERKQGSITGEIEAAFRRGAGNIQLALETPGHYQPIGGGPKMYGKEVREAIREMQKVAGAKVTGVELPTSINNLSGFSEQGFSEQVRQTNLEEVRDAIKFIGDIAGGGTVDIVSFEFQRNFADTDWAKKEGNKFRQLSEERPAIVDSETGQIQQFHPNQTFFLYKEKGTNKESDKPQEWTWNDFKKLAEALGVTPPNVTGIIDRLVEQALVTRTENPEDRRIMLLQTTEKGHELLDNLLHGIPDPFSLLPYAVREEKALPCSGPTRFRRLPVNLGEYLMDRRPIPARRFR